MIDKPEHMQELREIVSEPKPLPRDCQVTGVDLILSETRGITIKGLSVSVSVFELDNGFQIENDEEYDTDNVLPWYAIEELKEILDWLAQFREPISGNEELDFEKLWQAAIKTQGAKVLSPDKSIAN
jgi:hypothetical protein